MSKTKYNQTEIDTEFDLLPEYDFSGGVRGKHASAYRNGCRTIIHKKDGSTEIQELKLPSQAILLDSDVYAYFKDAKNVNQTLRNLIALIPTGNVEHIISA